MTGAAICAQGAEQLATALSVRDAAFKVEKTLKLFIYYCGLLDFPHPNEIVLFYGKKMHLMIRSRSPRMPGKGRLKIAAFSRRWLRVRLPLPAVPSPLSCLPRAAGPARGALEPHGSTARRNSEVSLCLSLLIRPDARAGSWGSPGCQRGVGRCFSAETCFLASSLNCPPPSHNFNFFLSAVPYGK